MIAWVATAEEHEERQEHARGLIGLQLVAVHYVDLDYTRESHDAWRDVPDGPEWTDPPWRHDGFDAVDYGAELHFSDGRVFSVTWDVPGEHESVGLHEVPMQDNIVVSDAYVARWNVSAHWAPYCGSVVTNVVLHYVAWPAGGFWCPRISFAFGGKQVHFVLGEADADGQLQPSGNDIAVVFPPMPLPAWQLEAESGW